MYPSAYVGEHAKVGQREIANVIAISLERVSITKALPLPCKVWVCKHLAQELRGFFDLLGRGIHVRDDPYASCSKCTDEHASLSQGLHDRIGRHGKIEHDHVRLRGFNRNFGA